MKISRTFVMFLAVSAICCWEPHEQTLANEPAADGKQNIDVGVQLYSLRAQMEKDLPGTLALVQKMKLTDVEVASFYNHSAESFKALLDKNGLKASGVHFQWDRFTRDIDGIIKDAKALGCEYVTLPWIPHNGDFTVANGRDAAEKFNEWGRKLAEAGLKFTYHPHGYEFSRFDKGTVFDEMVRLTKPKYVNFEIDIFWAFDGGADPVQLMRKYPSRFLLMHLKDMRKGVKTPNYTGHEDVESDVTLGTGQLDIKAILAEAQKIGIKHYYLEDESSKSVEQMPESVRYIRSIGF